MIALCIILGVLLLIFLILMLSVHVYATFDDALTLRIRVLFVSYTILSPDKEKKEKKPKKPKKEKKKKQKEPEKEEKEKEKKPNLFQKLRDKHGLPGILSLITELARIAGGMLKSLFAHIVIHRMDIGIAFNGGDPANTAETYGKICGAVYGSVNVIAGISKLKDHHVAIEPVFDPVRPTEVYADVHAHVRLIWVVGAALRTAFRVGLLWLKARFGKA